MPICLWASLDFACCQHKTGERVVFWTPRRWLFFLKAVRLLQAEIFFVALRFPRNDASDEQYWPGGPHVGGLPPRWAHFCLLSVLVVQIYYKQKKKNRLLQVQTCAELFLLLRGPLIRDPNRAPYSLHDFLSARKPILVCGICEVGFSMCS